ncbi:hypothetical protein K9L05_04080 [Candidatus Babeliales bacterium]|nr:hypothetical protein [Candidatus Babeliales bacterium]MCF7899794.1 hypothetical protein [Candidatus Babeliales bacterium]
MKLDKNFSLFTSLSFGLLTALIFSGCDFSKKDSTKDAAKKKEPAVSGEVVLLSINEKPVMKKSDFDKHLVQMTQMHPMLRGASPESLPKPLQKQLFNQLVKQEIAIAYATKNNFEKDPEFIKAFDEMKDLVKRSLLAQRFEAKILDGIKISDTEVEEFFNKDKEKYIKEPGGVSVEAISFKNPVQATDFIEKAKSDIDNFAKLAKSEKNGEFKDFGRVNKHERGPVVSGIPEKIKEKALSTSKFPSIDKIEINKVIWVIKVSDKKDDVFFSLDEIKPQLTEHLKTAKAREVFENKLKEIEKEFTVDINEDFFKEKEVENSDQENSEKEPAPSAAA